MFFITYLRRELRRRMRQAIFIALGLALGVGLVVTVVASSDGVKKAQSDVLDELYGVGTDVTVTGAAPGPPKSGKRPSGPALMVTPSGAQVCNSAGKCTNADGKTIDNVAPAYSTFSESKVDDLARLHDVSAAAGGLVLQDMSITIPKNFPSGGGFPQQNSISVDGVDVAHVSLGPLGAATLDSGHSLTAADSDSYVADVDSGYAKSHSLKVGSTIAIDKVHFTVIGIVSQPVSGSPVDVYIPLARAQALSTGGFGSVKGQVNAVYVTAASSADISAIQKEISTLLPGSTVTTASSLASEVTGSLSSASKLANDLGKWLSVLVLIAAFAVASLLTMAAVSRRAAEFGTLKAIGWRSRRIIAQVLGESAAMGIIGAAVGVGLGFAGAGIVDAVAPRLSTPVPGSNTSGPQVQATPAPGGASVSGSGPPPGAHTIGGSSTPHVVTVPLHPSVTLDAILLAVILAVLGGLLAGSFGSWRISRLRPAAALTRVA